MNMGKITQVIGPVVDVEFPPGALPPIYNALKVSNPAISDPAVEPGARGGAAPRREHGARIAMDATEGLVRGMEVQDTGDGIKVPVGPQTPRPHHQRHRRAGRRGRPDRGEDLLPDPPPGAGVHRPGHRGGGVRDRHQGRRPARALLARRQDRPLRRRRRRQDRHHHGADQQRRQAARRLLRVRRRRRAHPRGQRPVARDARVGRHLAHRAGLRPDERAARRARPRRPHRAHRRRVLPRRGGQGRAALHRQHLPLHPGQLRGVGPARPHALRRRLPADPVHRPRRAARSASPRRRRARSPRCRRSTCPPTTSPTRRRRPRSPTSTPPPCCRARSPSSASTPRWTRSTPPRASSIPTSSARSTTRLRARCRRSCSATRTCRTSSPSSAWTSSRKRTS